MRVNKTQLLAAAAPLGDTGGWSYDRLVGSLYYLVENALLLGGFAAVIMIVYYGVRMAVSRDDPGAFSTARGHLLQAFVGAAIIFGVYTIIATVQGAVQSIGQ